MRFLLLAFLLALPACASSKDVVIKRGDLTVTLFDKKCTSKPVQELAQAIGAPEEMRSKLKAGHASAPDGEVDLCYVNSSDPQSTVIFIIDELGNMGAFDTAPKK